MVKPQRFTGILLASLLALQISNSLPGVSAQTNVSPLTNSEQRQRGIQLYRAGDFPEATKALRKALKENSADDDGWYYLGLSLLHQPKDSKDASKAFESALKLRPNFAGAHTGLSYSLLLRNKSSDALREAQKALSIDQKIPDAHYIVGVIRLRDGAHEAALDEADTAIGLSPQFPSAYLLKSQALVRFYGNILTAKENETAESRSARFKQAADALEKYLQLEPNSTYKQSWKDQLDSLRFYSQDSDKTNERAFSGKQVTTKARVIKKPEPSYTEEARRNQVTGTVVLRAIFTADGAVKHFLIVSGLPNGLTEAAIRAAQKIKFTPAMIDGKPVSMFIQLEYNFNLY